jgi:hypothetical protein
MSGSERSRFLFVALLAAAAAGASAACLTIDERPTEVMAATVSNGGSMPLWGMGGSGGSSGSAPAGNCESAAPTAGRVRACVLADSCSPLERNSTISECVTYGRLVSCEENAVSCEDVNNCQGVKREPAESCSAGETGWKCSGELAIRCDGSAPYSIDCARFGATCDLFAPGVDVTAGRMPCKLPSPASCTPDDPDSTTCSGNSIMSCIEGLPYGFSCGTWGLACVEDTPGQAYCTAAPPCDGPLGVVSCVGNSIQVCDTTGRFATYDCTPAGATCSAVGTSSGYCLAPGCDPEAACTEQCLDATQMQICVGGAPFVVDCTSYGFTECHSYIDHPTTGNDYVRCR